MKNSVISILKKYKFKSVLVKNLILIFCVIILPLLAINITFYINYRQTLNNSVMFSVKNDNEKSQEYIDRIKDDTQKLLNYISLYINGNQRKNQIENPLTDFNTISYLRRLETFLRNTKNQNEIIKNIYVHYDKNSFLISTNGIASSEELVNKPWYLNLENEINIITDKKNNSLIFTKQLTNDFLEKGVLIIEVDIRTVEKYIFNNYGVTLSIFSKGIPVFSDVSFDNYSILEDDKIIINNQNVSIQKLKSNSFDWTYVFEKDLLNYSKTMNDYTTYLATQIIITILLAVLIAFFVSLRIYLPLKELLFLAENINTMDVDAIVQTQITKNEYNLILQNITSNIKAKLAIEKEFNTAVEKIDKLKTIALQTQITPHFIYNALESINFKVLSQIKGDNEISKMITKLSKLMRIALDTKESLTTIEKEIEHSKLYGDILLMRNDYNFKITYNIDHETFKYYIPKITLQPLLENAFYHGIRSIENGEITIQSEIVDANILISVKDNGLGIEKYKQDNINSFLKSNDNIAESSHLGLQNIHQRIKIFFGEEYGINIKSTPNSGTIVEIKLPKYIKD